MKDKITVIITIRNREAKRIENQVESIRMNGADPSFHIVDYGSDAEFAASYETICNKLNLRYTHLFTEGLPWNKCRAINYGVYKAETPFIVTSDVDMIYEDNPFQWCLDNYQEKSMYHIKTYWLPKNGNKLKASFAGYGNPGGFQFISKEAFFESGGYDERIEFWGHEDFDWPGRLQKLGYKQVWLPDSFKLFHTWHTKSLENIHRPLVAEYNTGLYCFQNLLNPIITNKKVNFDAPNNRPILKKIDTISPVAIELEAMRSINYYYLESIAKTINEKKFIKISFSQRIIQHKFPRIRLFFQRVCNKFSKITGCRCIPDYNHNFDIVYNLLTTLQQNGLIDYYISKDLSCIFLLFQ